LDRKEEQENKGLGKLHVFLIMLIVLIFIAGAVLITATISGKSIGGQAEKLTEHIPFLGEKEEKAEKQTDHTNQAIYVKEIAKLKSQLKDQEDEAASLEKILENKEQELKRSQLTVEQLEQTISELDQKEKRTSRSYQDIVDTYEKMAPKQASLIVAEMNEKEAVKILSSITTESLAAIMEKLEAKKAAALMEKITAEKENLAEESEGSSNK
jgi:flagellar motility protein MotE (MotC chaperone)